MTDKVTLTPIGTFVNDSTAVSAYNNNLTTITSGFDQCLFLNGTAPNQMQSNLDMNSNQILNLPSPAGVNSPARLIDVTSNPTITVPPTGTSGAVVPLLNASNTWSAGQTQTFAGPVTHSGTETFNGPVVHSSSDTFNSTVTFNTSPSFAGGLAIPSSVTGILPASNGGGMVLLNTLTSGWSDSTSFTSTYSNYLVLLDTITVSGGAASLGVQSRSGGSFKNSGYLSLTSAFTTVYTGTNNTTYIGATIGQDASATIGASGYFYVCQPSATGFCVIIGAMSYPVSGAIVNSVFSGYWNTSAVVTGIRLSISANSILSGTMKIYGMA
jgi:hypothetical protein